MNQTFLAMAALAAYLLGSIPSAVWIGKWFFNIDVRAHGSGNAGASNTLRILGKKAGITVLFLDFLKGLAASSLVLLQHDILDTDASYKSYQMLFGVLAVIGHVFPIFAGFKGGKGIATLLGMTVGISGPVSLLCALTFILVVWISKYISLGSMIGTLLSPLFVIMVYGPNEPIFMYFCAALALMVIYTHRSNVQRLRAGTESKFAFNKKPEIENAK